jgi:hypothetical protein
MHPVDGEGLACMPGRGEKKAELTIDRLVGTLGSDDVESLGEQT